jgi:hypothetical protein
MIKDDNFHPVEQEVPVEDACPERFSSILFFSFITAQPHLVLLKTIQHFT